MKALIDTLYKQTRERHSDREGCFFLDAGTDAGNTLDLHDLRIPSYAAMPLADVHHGLACLGAVASVLSGLAAEEDTGARVAISRSTQCALLDGMAVFSNLLQARVKDIGTQIEHLQGVPK